MPDVVALDWSALPRPPHHPFPGCCPSEAEPEEPDESEEPDEDDDPEDPEDPEPVDGDVVPVDGDVVPVEGDVVAGAAAVTDTRYCGRARSTAIAAGATASAVMAATEAIKRFMSSWNARRPCPSPGLPVRILWRRAHQSAPVQSLVSPDSTCKVACAISNLSRSSAPASRSTAVLSWPPIVTR